MYKELLNHYMSPALRTYVNTRVDKLIEINPEINMDPLRTRTHQHFVNRTHRPTREAECPTCGLTHAGSASEYVTGPVCGAPSSRNSRHMSLIGKIPEVSGQATVPGGACGAG